MRARATHLAPRFGCGRRTTRARAKSRDSRHMAKEKRGKEAKAKAEEATKEVTAGAAHAASGVSGAAGAVTEEAARLAGDAADSVKGAVETAGDAAKSISRSITSAVGGAIHKARRPAHPRGAPIFSQLGFPRHDPRAAFARVSSDATRDDTSAPNPIPTRPRRGFNSRSRPPTLPFYPVRRVPRRSTSTRTEKWTRRISPPPRTKPPRARRDASPPSASYREPPRRAPPREPARRAASRPIPNPILNPTPRHPLVTRVFPESVGPPLAPDGEGSAKSHRRRFSRRSFFSFFSFFSFLSRLRFSPATSSRGDGEGTCAVVAPAAVAAAVGPGGGAPSPRPQPLPSPPPPPRFVAPPR